VIRDLDLPTGATFNALGPMSVPLVGAPERIKNFLTLLVQSRANAIRTLRIIDRPWPVSLSVDQVPWKIRTRNALAKGRILERITELPRLAFGDLFDIPGMGARSILDFACTLEAVLASGLTTLSVDPDDDLPVRVSNLLIRVLDEPWADWISERDPRFADLLPKGQGTLTERIDALTSNPETTLGDLEALAAAVSAVRSRIENLGRQPLEEALANFVSAFFSLRDRRLVGMIARLQLDGAATPKTQDEAGLIAGGVTRQRIQQLEARGMSRLPEHGLVLPQLDRAIECLIRNAPIEARAASQLLTENQIARSSFHPSSVIAAAQLLKRAPSIEIRTVYQKEMVVAIAYDSEVVPRVVHVARRQAAQAGASSIAQVVDVLQRDGCEVADDRVTEILRVYGGAEFLSDDWFCFPLAPNDSVRNIARKMLSVTTPLGIATIREGVRRQFKFRASSGRATGLHPIAPTRDVLASYFKLHPDFAIGDDGSVRSVVPLDYRAELGGVETVIVTVLRSAPSRVLDRTGLTEACVERGVNTSTLWTLATYSPVIEHVGTGLWTLCGTSVDPTIVESFRKANALRPRERRVIDHGWLPTGELWVAVRLPALSSFVFPVPADIGRLLTGRDFAASDSEGVQRGLIRVQDGSRLSGVLPLLRRAGADVDDIALVRFDLAQSRAAVSVVDDDALEELSPQS
jgi:hypothetical protein